MSECCAPCQPPVCPPTQGITLFFPGTAGPPGQQGPIGDAGPDGPAGNSGAVGVYVGTWSPTAVYYDNSVRKDIVDWAGSFWIANNAVKNGAPGWFAPTVSDWNPFGASLVAVATMLKLIGAQSIGVGVTINLSGFLQSQNYAAGSAGWLLTAAGNVQALDPLNLFSGSVSTDTPKFNLASTTRTMPAVASVTLDLGAVGAGAIPDNPTINNVTDNAFIFFGWLQGANSFLLNRFGNASQTFLVNAQGFGVNNSAGAESLFIELYYRLRSNGGAWGAWTPIGFDAYMRKLDANPQTFQNVQAITLTLNGAQDIQFSVGLSKSAGGTNISVNGVTLSVQAFN